MNVLDVFCLMNQSSKNPRSKSDQIPGFWHSLNPIPLDNRSFMTMRIQDPQMSGSTTTPGFSSQGSEPPENGREDYHGYIQKACYHVALELLHELLNDV